MPLSWRGSSPRMRGALVSNAMQHVHLRIIPADAGSTPARTCKPYPTGDHPRGCGEHTVTRVCGLGVTGSSPRMRGALRITLGDGHGRGIIPADAGSTQVPHTLEICPEDHPRGCGEHISGTPMPLARRGSSPRMRGARPTRSSSSTPRRIIPADAGSTDPLANIYAGLKDHPRGCGEHWSGWYIVLSVQGSSPRMRGARSRSPAWLYCPRIIPADAGSTI